MASNLPNSVFYLQGKQGERMSETETQERAPQIHTLDVVILGPVGAERARAIQSECVRASRGGVVCLVDCASPLPTPFAGAKRLLKQILALGLLPASVVSEFSSELCFAIP